MPQSLTFMLVVLEILEELENIKMHNKAHLSFPPSSLKACPKKEK